MSNTCNNCNIQNSNSSINNNSGFSINRIRPPRRRYNPGSSAEYGHLDVKTPTSSVIKKILNIPQQSSFNTESSSSDSKSDYDKSDLQNQTSLAIKKILLVPDQIVEDDSVKKKSLEESNSKQSIIDMKTLEEINKVLNVDKSIIDVDNASNIRNLANLRLRRQVKSGITDDSNKTLINLGRVVNKVGQEVVKFDVKGDKKKKSSYINSKTYGTLLASSPQFKAKFNSLSKNISSKIEIIKNTDIPNTFDGRIVWKNYIQPVRVQGLCGSCWAFASTFALQSRLSIITNGKYNYNLSPAKLVYCSMIIANNENNEIKQKLLQGIPYDINTDNKKNNGNYGCSGETLIDTWQFLYSVGVPEDSCLSYGDQDTDDKNVSNNLTLTNEISKTCADVTKNSYDYCPTNKEIMVSHKAGGYYYVKGELNIRKDVYHWGPCTTGIMLYQDFIDWDGTGIYEWDRKSASVGGHAVVIIGWGEENGKLYWIVRNSWGEDWGDKGYFKILRGVNHCEIEENVFVGFPNIPGIRKFIEHPILYDKNDFVTKYLWNIQDSGYKHTTYENLALGKINIDMMTKELYSIDSIPNFKTFIAGEMKIIKEGYKKACRYKKFNNFLIIIFLLIILYFI